MSKYKFAIAACARWESQFIVEWLNYYQLLGYDHVYLYCNDDDPHELYEKVLPFTLGRDPFVTFYFYQEQGKHRDMMLHFIDNHIQETEWVSFFDLDEFLRLPPDKNIHQFMEAFEDRADMMMFNWVFFGPNGHPHHPGTPVLSTYTRRQGLLHPFTKYVCRSSVLAEGSFRKKCTDNSFVHRISEYSERPIRALNVLGDDMATYYARFPAGAQEFNACNGRADRILDIAAIHHYAFRGEDAFQLREDRGLKGDFVQEKIWGDLAKSDDLASFLAAVNAVEDDSLMKQWERWMDRSYQSTVGLVRDLEKAARMLNLPWPPPPITMDDLDWTRFEHPMRST